MIGIFAGSGALPKEIFSFLNKNKKKYIILNLSNKKIKNSLDVKLGQFGKILNILKKNKVSKVIFAGYVKRPNLKSLKLVDDFISIETKNSMHVLNAISPAFTSGFELADLIINKSKIV